MRGWNVGNGVLNCRNNNDGLSWTEIRFDTISAIVAFLWVYVREIITFENGPFGTFVNTTSTINAIFCNVIGHYILSEVDLDNFTFILLKHD